MNIESERAIVATLHAQIDITDAVVHHARVSVPHTDAPYKAAHIVLAKDPAFGIAVLHRGSAFEGTCQQSALRATALAVAAIHGTVEQFAIDYLPSKHAELCIGQKIGVSDA